MGVAHRVLAIRVAACGPYTALKFLNTFEEDIDSALLSFGSQPVRVRIGATTPAMLLVGAIAAGTARFSVDAVWLELR